jgi:hypothetical protein
MLLVVKKTPYLILFISHMLIVVPSMAKEPFPIRFMKPLENATFC